MKIIPPDKEKRCHYFNVQVGSIFSIVNESVSYYLKIKEKDLYKGTNVIKAVDLSDGRVIYVDESKLCVVHENPILYVEGTDIVTCLTVKKEGD